jgi:hypothetical protein
MIGGFVMDKKIVLVSEQLQKGSSGESVEGITVMVDGILKQFLDIIRQKSPKYTTNLSVVQDALMRGLELLKNEIS